MEEIKKQRERNRSHFWGDKQVYRFFRKNSDKQTYHKFFSVYTALCIIDSDFCEYRNDLKKGIANLTKTCATYAGIDKNIVSVCLQVLRAIGLIDYGPKRNENGTIFSSYLTILEFNEESTKFRCNGIQLERNSVEAERFKNNILYILYNTFKNSSKEEKQSLNCFINKTKTDFDKSDAGNDFNSSLATNSVAHKNNQIEIKENNTVDLNKKVPRKLKQPVVKEKPKPVVSKEIENLIIFWNGLNIVTHRPNTKTYYEIASCLSKLMAGNFFDKNGPFVKYSDKKFTSQEITETMTRFALAATNFNYLPVSDYKKILKKTGIIHFLHNPFGKQEKSLFLEYFENPPQLLKEETRLTTDDDPETTRIIKSFWVKKVLGGIKPVSWSNQDENNFRRAGKSLTKFIKSNIKRITTEFGLGGDDIKAKRDRVELLFEAILDDINDDTSKLTTGWLCSSMTWNARFPKYLFAQGIIEEE